MTGKPFNVHPIEVIKDPDSLDDDYAWVVLDGAKHGSSCEVWYPCKECLDATPSPFSEDDQEEGDLGNDVEKHGEIHKLLDGDWMTLSGRCAIHEDSSREDLQEIARDFGLGKHEVEVGYWGDGIWEVHHIRKIES